MTPQMGKYRYSDNSVKSQVDLCLIRKTSGTSQSQSNNLFPWQQSPTPPQPIGDAHRFWLKAVKTLGSFIREMALLNSRHRLGELERSLLAPPPSTGNSPRLTPQLLPLGNKHFHFLSPLSSPAAGCRAKLRVPPPCVPIGQRSSPGPSALPVIPDWSVEVHTLGAAPPPEIRGRDGSWNSDAARGVDWPARSRFGPSQLAVAAVGTPARSTCPEARVFPVALPLTSRSADRPTSSPPTESRIAPLSCRRAR